MRRVGIGLIGCGNISAAYLEASRAFPILDIRALGDLDPAAAAAKADAFGLRAAPIDEIFVDPEIEIILNLTVPKAHVEVGLRAISSGKHVYSEKPLAISVADGKRLIEAASARELRVGCAPDTFLGGAHQVARRVVDEGALGTPVGGTAFFMCPGHERWHPNPDFYYETGGGPVLDMAPYYLTDLVNLLGPIASVAGMTRMPRRSRVITSQPRAGTEIPVHVPTHAAGLLAFEDGAVVQIAMSFDVAGHRHPPIEIYGTEATLIVPDPNRFGGRVELLPKGGTWSEVPVDLPWADGNYRSIGLAEMAEAIVAERPHRASGELALHVLEAMEAIGQSSESRTQIELTTRARRPDPLGTPFGQSTRSGG